MSPMQQFRATLEQRFTEQPHDLAVQFKMRHLKNCELEGILLNLRRDLNGLLGCRTVILLPDSLAAYVFYVHLFLEQAVIIPVSPSLTADKIAVVCERAIPDLIITNDFFFRAHNALLTRYPCLVARDPEPGGLLEYQRTGPGAPLLTREDPEPVRMMIFTSGSTGLPKGVCLSEENILAAAEMMVDFLPLTSETMSVVTVPLYDYYGMIQVYGHILGHGTCAFGATSAIPTTLFSLIRNSQCTDLVLVPHTLRALLSARDAPDLRALKRITTSSDTLTDDLLQQLFKMCPDVIVTNIYGLTECGRAVYRNITKSTPLSRSVGRPSKGVTVTLHGTREDPGEIVIRGPNVMLGYLSGVQNGRLRFSPCDEIRTGDLGYFDEGGELILLGRRDHLINLMGMKIHPSEIESEALRVPGISDAKAAVYQTNGTKSIRLEVVSPGCPANAAQILERMRSRLPRVFVPTRIDVVRTIDRTEIGSKILR